MRSICVVGLLTSQCNSSAHTFHPSARKYFHNSAGKLILGGTVGFDKGRNGCTNIYFRVAHVAPVEEPSIYLFVSLINSFRSQPIVTHAIKAEGAKSLRELHLDNQGTNSKISL